MAEKNQENQEQENDDENKGDGNQEKSLIPKSRFDSVINERNDLRERMVKLEEAETKREKEAKDAEEERLKAKQEFEQLYEQEKSELSIANESLSGLNAKVDAYETSLKESYEKRLTAVPEPYHVLLANLSLVERLKWMNDNESLLNSSEQNGIPETPHANGGDRLSDAERRKKSFSAF